MCVEVFGEGECFTPEDMLKRHKIAAQYVLSADGKSFELDLHIPERLNLTREIWNEILRELPATEGWGWNAQRGRPVRTNKCRMKVA